MFVFVCFVLYNYGVSLHLRYCLFTFKYWRVYVFNNKKTFPGWTFGILVSHYQEMLLINQAHFSFQHCAPDDMKYSPYEPERHGAVSRLGGRVLAVIPGSDPAERGRAR